MSGHVEGAELGGLSVLSVLADAGDRRDRPSVEVRTRAAKLDGGMRVADGVQHPQNQGFLDRCCS
jgi:hypothetical protein